MKVREGTGRPCYEPRFQAGVLAFRPAEVLGAQPVSVRPADSGMQATTQAGMAGSEGNVSGGNRKLTIIRPTSLRRRACGSSA